MTDQRAPTLANGAMLQPYPLAIVRKLETKTTHAGMSRPYLARRVEASGGQAEQVVIKIADVGQEHGRFINTALQREEQLLRQLNHPSIVKLLPIPEPDGSAASAQPVYSARLNLQGRPWFIMLKYVAGGSLRDHWDSYVTSKMSLYKRLILLYDIASALDLIHTKGWAHLDVKPENILFKDPPQGDGEVSPVLIDFGIANRIGEVPDTEAGTTPYMAPERFRAGQPVSADMDIWALGVMFYQMLTGKHPFEQDGKLPRDDDNLAWARLLENHQPVPPSQVRNFSDVAQVNSAIDALVLRMLSKNPGDRAAMNSVSGQLQDIAHIVEVTEPQPPGKNSLSWIMGHPVRLAASLVGLLLLALIVLGISAFMRAVPPPPATPVPIAEAAPAAESAGSANPGNNPLPLVTPSPAPTPTPTATLPPITPGAAFDFGDGRTGVFIQGNQDPAAGPLREPFFMLDSEVTNAQYQACMDAGGCTAPIAADLTTLGAGEEYNAHPVTGIDAQQAMSYTIWAGGALPTDDEWFQACTGGDGDYIYPWGGQPIPQGSDEMPANVEADGTLPVGLFPVNGTPYGLHDIVGNVWEWTTTADGYRLRGGAWGGKTTDARCTAFVDAGAGKLGEDSKTTGTAAVDASEIGFRMAWPYDPSRVLVAATPTPAPTVTTVVYVPAPTPDPCPAGAMCVKIPPPPNGIVWLDPICVRIPADRSGESFVITTWPDLKDPNQEIKRVNVFLYLPENRGPGNPTAAADASQDRDNARRLSIRATGGTEFNVQLKNETDYEQTAEIRFDGLDLVQCKP